MKLLSLFVTGALLIGANSQAQIDERYYELGSMSVEEVSQPALKKFSQSPICAGSKSSIRPNSVNALPVDISGIELSDIVNMGQKAWAIVLENQPVVNMTYQTAQAIPRSLADWSDLECWQIPESKIYRVTYKNLYGVNVINAAFRVSYTYGGRLAGKGRFLSQVSILPAELDVSWGFKVNGNVNVAGVTNAGTKADPIGSIQLDINWKVTTPFKYSETTQSFYVRGDGYFKQLQ